MAQIDVDTAKALRANIYAGSQFLGEDAADPYLTNSSTATMWRITDSVGTLRGRLDLGGNIVGAYSSFPYGDGASSAGTPGTALFTGKDHDQESNLDYFGAQLLLLGSGQVPEPGSLGAGLC